MARNTEGSSINPFLHTLQLLQTSLKTFSKKYGKSLNLSITIELSWNHYSERRNSNFCFCHNDFKSCLVQSHQKYSLCVKGLSLVLCGYGLLILIYFLFWCVILMCYFDLFLASLYSEYESCCTRPDIAVGVTLWLRFCMQVHKVHHSSVTTWTFLQWFPTMTPMYITK